MPKEGNQNFQSEEFKIALTKMVDLYGNKKWAQVARGLNTIHGYDIKNSTAAARWHQINPELDRNQFSYSQEIDFWDLCLMNQANMIVVQQHYRNKDQKMQKTVLWNRFRTMYKNALNTLIRILGRQKRIQNFKIKHISDTTIKKVIELNFDKTENTDEEYAAVRQSCQTLMSLCSCAVKNQTLYRQDLQQQLIGIADKDEFTVMIDHVMHINVLQKIRYNTIGQGKSTQEDMKKQDNSDEYSSDQDHFPEFYKKVHPKKKLQNPTRNMYKDPIEDNLNMVDIQRYRNSMLYQKLFQTKCPKFYEWYNTAKIAKTQDQQEYIVDFSNKGKYVPQKKVKVDHTQQHNQAIQTVRGKIRTNKKLFKNSMTIKFNYDQEELENQHYLEDDENEQDDQICKMFGMK